MNTLRGLWEKLKIRKYRAQFVAAQVKRGIPFQIQALMKQKNFSQERLARESGLTQGVISRAANPDYGNLTLNTIIKIAAGFDIAFVGEFVPFSELGNWFANLSEEMLHIKNFEEEDAEMSRALGLGSVEEVAPRLRGNSQGDVGRGQEMGLIWERCGVTNGG